MFKYLNAINYNVVLLLRQKTYMDQYLHHQNLVENFPGDNPSCRNRFSKNLFVFQEEIISTGFLLGVLDRIPFVYPRSENGIKILIVLRIFSELSTL